MRKVKTKGLFLIILFSCFFLYSCTKKKTPINKENKKESPTQIIKNANLLRSTNGIVDTQLKAENIEVYNSTDSNKMIFPKGLQVNFLNPDKSIKAYLSSLYAESQQNNTYYLKDSVIIINYKDQDTFYCKDLYWIKDSAIVRTHKKVRRHSETGIDYAQGLQATDNFDSIKVEKPYGTQKIKEE